MTNSVSRASSSSSKNRRHRKNDAHKAKPHHLDETQKNKSMFSGGCDALNGHYFDCSSYSQADRFVNTLKEIIEHVGRTYKYGGDIRATIDNLELFKVPAPLDPADNYQDVLTSSGRVSKSARDQVSFIENETFRQEIQAYVKRKGILQSNVQQSYSLVLGQCTEMMKNKLKSSDNWLKIKSNQDVLELLSEIRSITFCFEDQKYQPLSIHQAKTEFYAFRQGNMNNADYLQRFRNLSDIAISLQGNVHDKAILKIACADEFNSEFIDLDSE